MKSLSAIASRIPKKSFSSILSERHITRRLAPSGTILEKKWEKMLGIECGALLG